MILILFLSESLIDLECPLHHPSFNFVDILVQILNHIPQLKDPCLNINYFKDTNFVNFISMEGPYTDEKITGEGHLARSQVNLSLQHLMLKVRVSTFQQNIHKVWVHK